MKIHLFGASGSGVSTLGSHLAGVLGYPYFDVDSFYWAPSDPPFTMQRTPAARHELLVDELAKHTDWVLGGSIVSWGSYWLSAFDLAVFLWIPPGIRMERLKKREYERYGDVIFTDPYRHQLHLDFMDWAAQYDDPASTKRSLVSHEQWIKELQCPVLEIRGDRSVEQRTEVIVDYLRTH